MNFVELYSADDEGICGKLAQLLIPRLNAGEYILGIGNAGDLGTGEWEIEIKCYNISQTPTNNPTNTIATYQIDGHIACGDIVTGQQIDDIYINFYYFNLTQSGPVLFDSCYSGTTLGFDTILYLYDMDFIQLYWSDDEGICGEFAQLFIPKLNAGQYILGIGSSVRQSWVTRKWEIEIKCNNITHQIYDQSVYLLLNTGYNLYPVAERSCETWFGTTLATIITDSDMAIAQQLARKNGIWIGMYGEIANNDTKLQWVDGTSWLNSTYWSQYQPNVSDDQLFGSYLKCNNADNDCKVFQEDFVTLSDRLILCNAITANRGQSCKNKLKCWISLNCCSDGISQKQYASDLYAVHSRRFDVTSFTPPIAYWNSKLIIIGLQYIYSTNLALFDGALKWNYTKMDDFGTKYHTYIDDHVYGQYKSSLFAYVSGSGVSDYDYLMHVDLDNLNLEFDIIPIEYQLATSEGCLTVDANYVYLITASYLQVYEIATKQWSFKYIFDTTPYSCAITNDYQFIYVFGQDVLRYNISNASVSKIDEVTSCYLL